MVERRNIKAALHVIADLADLDQALVYERMLLRIEECGAQTVDLHSDDFDVLVILVLHGNSARQIVETVDGVNCPCIIWAARERWAWPSSALAMGKLRDEAKAVKLIYGQPSEEDAVRELGIALRAAFAVSEFAKSRIGVIGGLYPNLVSCAYDRAGIAARLGMGIVDVSFDEVRDAIGAITDDAVESCIDRFPLLNEIDEELRPTCTSGIRLHLAMKHLTQMYSLCGFAVECWSRFPSELGMNPCLGFLEDDYIMACEGDVLLAASHILARVVTGNYSYAGDIYDLDDQNVLTLNHCGAPMSLSTNDGISAIQESKPAADLGFSTLVCHPAIQCGRVTLLRLHGSSCNRLHMAEGEIIGVESLDRMSVRIRLDGSRKHFVDNCTGNHYVAAMGDASEEIRQFCKWKNIDLIET